MNSGEAGRARPAVMGAKGDRVCAGQTEVDFYNAALISVFSCENHFPR